MSRPQGDEKECPRGCWWMVSQTYFWGQVKFNLVSTTHVHIRRGRCAPAHRSHMSIRQTVGYGQARDKLLQMHVINILLVSLLAIWYTPDKVMIHVRRCKRKQCAMDCETDTCSGSVNQHLVYMPIYIITSKTQPHIIQKFKFQI